MAYQQAITHRTTAGPLPPATTKTAKVLTALLLLTCLAACRVVITVPPGGQVTSDEGTVCLAGQTCTIDVTSASFADIFSAEPVAGYTFAGWCNDHAHLCGDSTQSCAFTMVPHAGLANISDLLAMDFDFYLEPRFVADEDEDRYPVATWRDLLSGLNSSFHRSNAFLYDAVPDQEICDAGALTQAARDRFLDSVNLIRQLHHLPPVQYDNTYDNQMQETALVQIANFYLTHSPQPGDNCYSAAAAAGAGSSNLSHRSVQGDPAAYPLGWVNDNYNISTLMAAGHRRWVLHPGLIYTAYGQTRGDAAMKVFGFGPTPPSSISPTVEYIAFPYLRYPHVMVSQGARPTPWSISMVPPAGSSSSYDHFSLASVSVVNSVSGAPLNVHSEYFDNSGYGLRNFFSWMVDGWEHDTPYTVTISNVSMPDGSVRTIEYQVEIDFAELQ